MGSGDAELPLHAVLARVADKKRQWLRERGVSPEDSYMLIRCLPYLTEYLERKKLTGIQLSEQDQLKMAWCALGEEAAEEIKVLVEDGVNVDVSGKDGRTALHEAARQGMTDVVSLLLHRGADMNAVENHDNTVLHFAATSGSVDVVSLLLDLGANMNAVNNFGYTVLHVAAKSGSVDVISLLLSLGVDMNGVDKDGFTVLHVAAKEGKADVVSLLLDRGANIDVLDKKQHNPLGTTIWTCWSYKLNDAVAVARLLCSRGSNPNLLASIDKSSLEEHQKGLLACSLHWSKLHARDKELTEIPREVIEGGEDAVRTFLRDLEKTRSDELVYRCKVCIVGPSTWGKTSLVTSMISKTPSLVNTKDRTIGIDLFPLSFDENSNNGGIESNVKRHHATFWDFAGQDIYQVTHALFYSERTLYLVCVDLSKYADKVKEMKTCSRSERGTILQRFFEENVLRWVRLILFRQPSAHFKVIGTKDDLVSEDQLKHIMVDMDCQMQSFVDNLAMDGITADIKRALEAEFKSKNMVTTSAGRVDSIETARKSVERTIIEKPEFSFKMTVTYSKVLDWILEIKQSCSGATLEERVDQGIVPFKDLFARLECDIQGLEDARECREILRILHRLGDVMWYEDEAVNPDKLVILDPKIMLELVREVVNHSYEERTEEPYKALRRDGTLHHSLLMTFSWWKALDAVDSKMVHLFKYLLQYFNLAYPASNVDELATVDMIVPTYWKTRAAVERVGKPLAKQQSMLEQNNIVGSVITKWQYSLPIDISDAVYVNFVVRSFRRDAVRKVGAAYVESFVRGEFGAVIYFTASKMERTDDITIEVAAVTEEIAWAEMRDLVMAMEEVLLKYPGLNSTKQGKLKRYIVHSNGNLKEVSNLMGVSSDMDRLHQENPWLPPDFSWFIQRAWTKPGKLDKLKAQKVVLQLPHRLEVLKQLVVSSENRQFPALWTLSYSTETEKPLIELRMHSDLSGVCYHVPLRITVPSKFVRDNPRFIQAGLSIVSLTSSLSPINIVSTAVEMALPGCQTALDRSQEVSSILAKAGLHRGEVKSSTQFDIPVPSRISFLRKLLEIYHEIHDLDYDDLKVSEVSNLCCAEDSETGRYVWIHERELEGMGNRLNRCHPPQPPITPRTTSKSISIRVTHLLWAGRETSPKTVYCEWEVVHTSGQVANGKAEVAAGSGADITFSSAPVELASVSSTIMLSECTVKIYVKQPHQFRKWLSDKIIVSGVEELKNHVDADSSNLLSIRIALKGKNIAQPATVTCEISIV